MNDQVSPGDELKKVPSDVLGYAVGEGELRVGKRCFELDIGVSGAAITKTAIRYHEETSDVLALGFIGGTYRGDYKALRQIVDALKWFENQEAGITEDKLAYDTRTAFNHAATEVRNRLE